MTLEKRPDITGSQPSDRQLPGNTETKIDPRPFTRPTPLGTVLSARNYLAGSPPHVTLEHERDEPDHRNARPLATDLSSADHPSSHDHLVLEPVRALHTLRDRLEACRVRWPTPVRSAGSTQVTSNGCIDSTPRGTQCSVECNVRWNAMFDCTPPVRRPVIIRPSTLLFRDER
jgi:hypothetical protein